MKTRVEALLRLHGAPKCKFCGDLSACVCERCVIQMRGPLWTGGVKVERRTQADGAEAERVVALSSWDETVAGEAGSVVTLRSDWFGTGAGRRSPIADLVDAIVANDCGANG